MNEKSDIDLCIVVQDGSNTDVIFEHIADFLSNYGNIIHPTVFSHTDFNKKMKIKVYNESILKKGKIDIQKNSNAY